TEERRVCASVRPACLRPRFEVGSLDPQDRGLNRIHSEIAADDLMKVLRLHSVSAQQPCACGQRRIVRRDEAGITKGTEILAREERKAAEGTDGADMATSIRRADRLRGIF